MKDILNIKINDYCGYAVLAVKNFRDHNYSDATHNCRKAAEVACKVIFYFSYPQKRAEEKTSGRSLKELILQLIKDNISERKTINTLEALQIYGNKASHDNVISKTEAAYALNALDLLTEYLFQEKLKIQIPAALNFNETEKKEPEIRTEVIEKIIIRENPDREKEEAWLKKLELLEQQHLEIKERLDASTLESKIVVDISEKAGEISGSDQKNQRILKKSLIALVLTTIVLSSIIWFVLIKTRSGKPGDISVINHRDTVYVAINNLRLMQDNPGMSFNIEKDIQSVILRKCKQGNIAVKTFFTDLDQTKSGIDSSLQGQAKRLGYDVIYWGNLYESALNDSNILEIKGSLTNRFNFFRNKKVKFKSLSDSSYIKEINDQCNTPVYSHCLKTDYLGDFDKKAALLNTLLSYSDENWLAIGDLKSKFFDLAENHSDNIKVLQKMLSIEPYPGFHGRLGAAHVKQQNYSEAEIAFLSGLEKDSAHTYVILEFANMRLLQHKYDSAKILYMKVLKIDPKNEYAKRQLKRVVGAKKNDIFLSPESRKIDDYAEELFIKEDYGGALHNYAKILGYIKYSANRLTRISQCYLMLKDTGNASKYFNMAMEIDSTDESTAIFAGALYESTSAPYSKTDYYYSRALALYPDKLSLVRNSSTFYLRIGNLKKCMNVGRIAEKTFPYDRVLLSNTALSALVYNDYTLAVSKFEYLNLIYPGDTNMAYLAQAYLSSSKGNIRDPNFKKGMDLITKAVELNPKNKIAIGVYNRFATEGFIAMETEKYNKLSKFSGNNATVKSLSPVTVYADKSYTISTLGDQNTFIEKYQNGSTNSKGHNRKGSLSSGTTYNKGKGPPVPKIRLSDRQIVDMVINNKKIKKEVLLRFLDIELGFFSSKKNLRGDELELHVQQVAYLKAQIKKLDNAPHN